MKKIQNILYKKMLLCHHQLANRPEVTMASACSLQNYNPGFCPYQINVHTMVKVEYCFLSKHGKNLVSQRQRLSNTRYFCIF